LPTSLLEAAERERHPLFQPHPQIPTRTAGAHAKALRELIGKLPDYLKNDPSVEVLQRGQGKHRHRGASDLSQQELQTSSKDYDFLMSP
jgi:NTE family protein